MDDPSGQNNALLQIFVPLMTIAAFVTVYRQPYLAALMGTWCSWLTVTASTVSTATSTMHACRHGTMHPVAVPLLLACSVITAIAATVT
jgi:hypothetical protein